MDVVTLQGSSAGASLGAVSVAQLDATRSVAAMEGDFLVSRVHVSCVWAHAPEVVAVASKRGPYFLVLSSGAMTVAQVEDALDGTFNIDLTPAGGDLSRVNIAHVKGIVMMIPFKRDFIMNDNDATAEGTVTWIAEYNGPPLGLSLADGRKRSWLFPKNIGYRWMLFAAGNGSGAGTTAQLYSRMTGRFTDD